MTADETREGVELTHLDQPLSDEFDVTKRELLDYLDAISDRLIPVLSDRPLSVIRTRPGSAPFMQKNLPKYAPDWVRRTPFWAERTKRTINYPVCDDRRTLLWLGNQRCVEFHPTLFTLSSDDAPTHLIMDIDPPEGAAFDVAVGAAELVHQALIDSGLDGAVKSSGAKGLHIFVPIAGADAEQAAAASRALAARAERLDPQLTTTAYVRDEREGKVFLDSTRAGGATVAAAYSPRLRPGLPVSFPVPWEALAELDPRAMTVRTALAVLGDSDPWSTLMPAPLALPQSLIDEGREIPIARVRAMHEGLRRARAKREKAAPQGSGESQESVGSGESE